MQAVSLYSASLRVYSIRKHATHKGGGEAQAQGSARGALCLDEAAGARACVGKVDPQARTAGARGREGVLEQR